MCCRILPVVKPRLRPYQYVCRRARGTERHLVSLMDGIRRALLLGKNLYVVSFDIAGAFGTVSHSHLVRVLGDFQIDKFASRLIRHWIVGRTFEIKRRTPQGVFYGRRTPITAGLPHGGSPFPLLVAHVLQWNT